MAEKKLKVFLIDDDADMLTLMKTHLAKNGNFVTREFASAADARKKLSSNPDAIVLDYDLDGAATTGADFLSEIKENNSRAEIILVAGQIQLQPLVDATRHDVFAVLPRTEHTFLQVEQTLGQIGQKRKLQAEASTSRTLAIIFGILLLLTIILIPLLNSLGYLKS